MAFGTIAAGASLAHSLWSGNKARKLQKQALQLQREQFEFMRGQVDKWEGTFGPIEQNLSNFYRHYTASRFATVGREQIDNQVSQLRTQLQQDAGRRGIDGSGAAEIRSSALGFQEALGKAQVTQNAPLQLAQAQQGFVQSSYGKYQAALGGSNQAAATYQGAANSASQTSLNNRDFYKNLFNDFAPGQNSATIPQPVNTTNSRGIVTSGPGTTNPSQGRTAYGK